MDMTTEQLTKELNAEEETIEILISGRYGGGFGMSDAALAIYNKLMRNTTPNGQEYESAEIGYDVKCRHNPVLVKIFKVLEKSFNSWHSNVCIRKINKKYINFYTISDYDGREQVVINYDAYKLHQIMQITESGITDADKIDAIIKIIKIIK